jgi:hypothetical protein
VRAHEPVAVVRREIGDPARLEVVVPALATFGRDSRGDGVRDLRLVRGTLHELHEFGLGESRLVQKRRAQARRHVVLAQVTTAQRRARFVDCPRQEHQPGEPRTRVARRAPAQADRAHRSDSSRHL